MNQTQQEVQFFLPNPRGDNWQSEESRSLIGKIAEESDNFKHLESLFNYKNGAASESRSLIRWCGGTKHCFRLIGVGDLAADEVLEKSILIRRLLSSHFNSAIKVSTYTHELALRPSPYMKNYYAITPSIFKTVSKRYQSLKSRELNDIIADRIISALHWQADEIGIPMPSEAKLVLTDIGDEFAIHQEFKSVSHPVAKIGYKFVKFSTNLDIVGHWAMGGLVNKGYGAILKDRIKVDERPSLGVYDV